MIYDLPEKKYIDSPLIGNYPHPYCKEIRVALTDDEKEYTDEQISNYYEKFIVITFIA